MAFELPKPIDLGTDVLTRASVALGERLASGRIDGNKLLTEGISASGVRNQDVIGIAVAISTSPETRELLGGQAPFHLGFAVGSAVLDQVESGPVSNTGGHNG